VAQAGGTQALTRKQVVGDGAPRDGVLVLEQQPRLFEHPLLAGGVHIHQHVGAWQDGGKTVHVGVSPVAAGRIASNRPSVTER
jgi:hypothetical protein